MKYKIKEIFDLQMGKTPARNNDKYWNTKDYKWISIADLTSTDKYINNTKEYISRSAVKESGIKIIPANTVVMSFKLSIGKTAILSEDMYSNEAIMAFHDKHVVELLPEYTYYLIKAKNWNGGSNRAVMGQTLNKATLSEIEVDVHAIEDQRKIVKLMSSIEKIIYNRKEQLQKLGDILRARFVEMFGDLKNTIRLGDCCKVHARIGWQALTRDEHMKTGEYMLVTGTDFIDGKINYNTCVYVTRERYEMDPHIILRENDILITKDGSIGKVAIIHNLSKPATLNSGVFVVRPKDIFNKEYISGVFRGPLFEKFIELSKTGATIKHLNQKHLVEFRIPLPTLEKQEVFARFSNQVNKSKLLAASQPQIHIYKTLTLL